jgi:hypothetical protein
LCVALNLEPLSMMGLKIHVEWENFSQNVSKCRFCQNYRLSVYNTLQAKCIFLLNTVAHVREWCVVLCNRTKVWHTQALRFLAVYTTKVPYLLHFFTCTLHAIGATKVWGICRTFSHCNYSFMFHRFIPVIGVLSECL